MAWVGVYLKGSSAPALTLNTASIPPALNGMRAMQRHAMRQAKGVHLSDNDYQAARAKTGSSRKVKAEVAEAARQGAGGERGGVGLDGLGWAV